MLKTYRIIPLVFILFLFGFTLITVSPVFAADSAAFVECTQLKHPQRNFKQLLNKKDCFRDLARALVTGGAVAQANGADSPEQVSTSGADDGMGDPNMPPPMGDPNMPLTSAQLSCTCTGCACDTGPYRKLHALTVELEAENARLLEQQGAPADPSGGEVARLNAKVAELETQVSVANAAQEPLNAKMAELEFKLHATKVNEDRRTKERDRVTIQLEAANAAQEPLNAKVAELETQVSAANAAFLGCTKINPEGYGTGLSRAVGGRDHATYVKAMKKQRDCFMSAAGL
jgi:outer membrane murein-binding lipoprotein Lpp